jgi:nucleoside-diphosphate-sugar epimerase
MKTALVTGGTGFIGYNLANALHSKGYKVVVLDKALNNIKHLNPNINFILNDVRKVDFSISFDVVYHLAALRSLPDSFIYPKEYISTNVWGTYNIIKSFPSSRVVFASSSAAAESKSVYGLTKKSAEHFVNLHNNAVSVRFMNVFGERQIDLQMAVPAFCYALKQNKKAIINGDGKLQRDYTYVTDLVTELISIGESRIKGQTETGYGTPISIIDLYKLLARTAKKKENFKFGPVRKGDMKFTCSKYKIKEPKYGFMEGIRRTVRWYLEEESF